MIRHGDILLMPAREDMTAYKTEESALRSTLGTRYPLTRSERIVLAEGEATGHAHVIEGNLLRTTIAGRTLLRAVEEALLDHEEHGPVVVPPGWYEVIRQRTYTPVGPRWVHD